MSSGGNGLNTDRGAASRWIGNEVNPMKWRVMQTYACHLCTQVEPALHQVFPNNESLILQVLTMKTGPPALQAG